MRWKDRWKDTAITSKSYPGWTRRGWRSRLSTCQKAKGMAKPDECRPELDIQIRFSKKREFLAVGQTEEGREGNKAFPSLERKKKFFEKKKIFWEILKKI